MEDIKRTDVWQKKLVIIQISEYNRIYDWRNTLFNYHRNVKKMGNYLETDSNFMRARSNRWRCEKGKNMAYTM